MYVISTSPTFKGRSPVLKDADMVCRAVKNTFPSISPTKIYYDNAQCIENLPRFKNFIIRKSQILHQYREDRKFYKQPLTFYKEVVYSTEKEKVVNCGELATLAELAMRLNGIKNCGRASLYTRQGVNLDHKIAYIDLRKKGDSFDPLKIIIIDPWLGIVDYLKNMNLVYKKQNNKYFMMTDKDILTLKPSKLLELSDEQINYFKEKLPDLVIKKQLFECKK